MRCENYYVGMQATVLNFYQKRLNITIKSFTRSPVKEKALNLVKGTQIWKEYALQLT